MEIREIVIGIASMAITAVMTVLGYFLKRTISTTDRHTDEISTIQRTYVTKDELKNVRDELTETVKALTEDVKEIKDNALNKTDFFRVQANTENKIDKIYDLLINRKE